MSAPLQTTRDHGCADDLYVAATRGALPRAARPPRPSGHRRRAVLLSPSPLPNLAEIRDRSSPRRSRAGAATSAFASVPTFRRTVGMLESCPDQEHRVLWAQQVEDPGEGTERRHPSGTDAACLSRLQYLSSQASTLRNDGGRQAVVVARIGTSALVGKVPVGEDRVDAPVERSQLLAPLQSLSQQRRCSAAMVPSVGSWAASEPICRHSSSGSLAVGQRRDVGHTFTGHVATGACERRSTRWPSVLVCPALQRTLGGPTHWRRCDDRSLSSRCKPNPWRGRAR